MGFDQVDFNKKILKMNDFILDMFDIFCDDLDWDSMQEDLQEMVRACYGFYTVSVLNFKLMFVTFYR